VNLLPRRKRQNNNHTLLHLFKHTFCLYVCIAGTIFKAHKLILAACSKNFADLFETPSLANGSVCVILEATSAENMAALLEFMYKGEVHVSQKALESFLKAAESLQVNE
jgi:BTB/POZ domain